MLTGPPLAGGDVGSVVRRRASEEAHPGVRALPGGGQVGAVADDLEHAAAGGHQLPVRAHGHAGTEHVDAVERPGRGEPLDGVAGPHGGGVALGRHDDQHRRARVEGAAGCAGRRSAASSSSSREVGGEAQEHHLAVGVAEADVVLDELRALVGDHQPGVEQPSVVDAASAELVQGGLHEPVDHVVGEARLQPRQRAVGAHAAGVGPGVAVADPLEVLRRVEGDRPDAVAQREHRHLRPRHPLLDHDSATGIAEGLAGELGAHVGLGLARGRR